jgi:hypothetical protein
MAIGPSLDVGVRGAAAPSEISRQSSETDSGKAVEPELSEAPPDSFALANACGKAADMRNTWAGAIAREAPLKTIHQAHRLTVKLEARCAKIGTAPSDEAAKPEKG